MNDALISDALLREALPNLNLNIAQTAAICGISVRQLGYWTQQGYVDAHGSGTRRTYGLPAIRRILAIRQAMSSGASLRQSLRQITAKTEAPAEEPGVTLQSAPDRGMPVPKAQSDTLSRALLTFLQRNSHTRDHAGGLAVKLGCAEEDVRLAAEHLCLSGLLSQETCQGMTIFHSAVWRVSHA